MAVESLECCLSSAIGSSCTGHTQVGSSQELTVLCSWGEGWTSPKQCPCPHPHHSKAPDALWRPVPQPPDFYQGFKSGFPS